MLLSNKIMSAWERIIELPHTITLDEFVIETLKSLYHEKYGTYPSKNSQGCLVLKDCYHQIQYECERVEMWYGVYQKIFMTIPVTDK